MDLASVGLFQLAERRLAWVEQRQTVLAQNIANAATPGYEARDVGAFEATLGRATPGLWLTQSAHIPVEPRVMRAAIGRPVERLPDGNDVSLADQLTKVADTSSAQELTTGLYRKYMGMFRTALGRNG